MSFLLNLPAIVRRRPVMACGVAVLSASVALLGATAGQTGTVNILETGSSLLYPLFNLWVPAFQRVNPAARITTTSTGSGTGISQAIEGIAQIGASDAYMSPAQMRQHPDMLNIPLAISMQMVNENLPGMKAVHLKLSGPVLAAIYLGRIRNWSDPAIARLNPGVRLPAHAIVPIHRTDGSGDTFLFTQYLSFSAPEWEKALGYGTTVSWPAVPGALGAVGNPGMITAAKDNPYSIAYIGSSYEQATGQAGLGLAALQNRAGNFVLPTARTAEAAALVMAPRTPPNERISLIYAPGPESYPIINYEYAIVHRKQPSPQVAAAMKQFFDWAISPNGGSAPQFMARVNFVPLPLPVAKLSAAQIAEIQ